MEMTYQQLMDALKSGGLGANSAKYSNYAFNPNYTGDRNDAQWSDYVSGNASGVGGPTSIETTEMGNPNKGRPEFRIIHTPDGRAEKVPIDYSSDSGNTAMNAGVMAMLAAMGGAAIGGAGAGAAGAGEGMGAGAAGTAGYAAPTAAELTAGGFGTGGMGMTGAGGIGSASSVAGAGAGAAGYGGAAAAGGGLLGGVEVGSGSLGVGGLTSAGGSTGGGSMDFLDNPFVQKIGGSLAGPLIGGLLGGSGASQSGNQTITNQQQIDPRMASMLYGPNGNDGFLSQILAQGKTPQNTGMAGFGGALDQYLGKNGASQLQSSMGAANDLQNSSISAPQINAPSQNNLNLAPGYQDMIYGAPGANPYLTGAIGKGINQSKDAFADMLTSSTRNLTENVLPSIRSGARVSGNYGGNREALAEGKALDTFNTGVGQAMTRFGQGNTDAAVSAQAGAYDTDRNRALSAMSGLGAQQYNVAGQNAQLQQQANQLNSANKVAGLGAASGLLGQAYGYGANQDAYGMNQIGKTSGLLSNYTGLGGSSAQTSPLYENKGAGILGGAMLGQQLVKGWGGSNSITSPYDPIFQRGGF